MILDVGAAQEIEILIDGKSQKTVKISPENLFTYDNKLVLEGAALTSGEHKVEIRKRGNGALYYNAYLTNFTLEDFITKAGLEVKVNRKFYKLVREDKIATSVGAGAGLGGQVAEQVAVGPAGGGGESGDFIEHQDVALQQLGAQL
mgnify:CR=1 FL=1